MWWTIPILLIGVLLLHESGHYAFAKLQGLMIDKCGFIFKPIPHFYVSVVDRKISMRQRILFLLGGNIFVLIIFVVFLLSGGHSKYVYYIFVYQIIVDTNPFYSDYVIAIMSYVYRNQFTKHYVESERTEEKQMNIDKLKDVYMFCPLWYLHCLLWGILIVLLVSPKFLNNYF